MNGMSLSSAMSEGLMVTGVGLCIVFAVLLLLMLVLMAMKKVFYKEPIKAVTTEVVNEPVSTTAPVQNDEDDEELIAILTAAIASTLNTSTYNLQIKSYRRIGNNSPAWNKAGLNEVINSHF